MGPKRTSFFGGWDTPVLVSRNSGPESAHCTNQGPRLASRAKSRAKRDVRRGPSSADLGERQGGQRTCFFTPRAEHTFMEKVWAGSKMDRVALRQNRIAPLASATAWRKSRGVRRDSALQHRVVGFLSGHCVRAPGSAPDLPMRLCSCKPMAHSPNRGMFVSSQ